MWELDTEEVEELREFFTDDTTMELEALAELFGVGGNNFYGIAG